MTVLAAAVTHINKQLVSQNSNNNRAVTHINKQLVGQKSNKVEGTKNDDRRHGTFHTPESMFLPFFTVKLPVLEFSSFFCGPCSCFDLLLLLLLLM